MKTYTIKVTKRDIERGQEQKGCGERVATCPAAIAVRRREPKAKVYARPDDDLYEVIIGTKAYVLSEHASRLIKDLDKKLPVKPFTFKLEI